MDELIMERLELAEERIRGLSEDMCVHPLYTDYFEQVSKWFELLFDNHNALCNGSFFEYSMDRLEANNRELYGELKGANYEKSYLNPAYAVEKLGENFGPFLSAFYADLRNASVSVFEGRYEEFAAAVEVFLEMEGAFRCAWEEIHDLPTYEEIKNIFYWYTSDYADIRSERQVYERVTPRTDRISQMIETADLSDLRYLYYYGLYVSECELKTAAFLNTLPEETIATMADTFTEGFRMGFVMGNKDLSIKKSASLHFNIGFERVIRRAMTNLRAMGLEPVMYYGTYSTTPVNRQFMYDHKDDAILFFDRKYMTRKLETVQVAFEQVKEAARGYAGPAVMEVFGEEPFSPASKPQCLKGDEKYQKLMVEYMSESRQIQSKYIIEEERSFTIIAFPTPDIGEQFEEIFAETIKINTLDYKLYQGIQQVLIDTLDTAEYAEIKGMNGNETDLRVSLMPLTDPAKQSKFENCVADVNIPVGEVFTSPVLKGTTGLLHVSKVFLNGLEFRDLRVWLEDGMVKDYSCANFENPEEGREFFRDNVLFHHETLPLGEFAIGTNTTAYMAGLKYDIGAKLPILIAEKTGPHFALGDTCYSHAEDVRVFNPDGKEIIARDNEVSLLRSTDPARAYFNCHTDITIPYHELGELTAVRADGSRAVLIKDGRFVLAGCEELNKPFDM